MLREQGSAHDSRCSSSQGLKASFFFFSPNQFTHYEGELRGDFSQRLLAEKPTDFKEASAITELINNNFPGVKKDDNLLEICQ